MNKRFITSFNFVMEYYECTREEAAYEKKRALANPYYAERCFNAFYDAHVIHRGNINERAAVQKDAARRSASDSV